MKFYLTKRNKIYYIIYFDEFGKRKTKSTKTRKKPEALKFLVEFKKYNSCKILLKNAIDMFLQSNTSKSKKYYEDLNFKLNQFLKFCGNIPIEKVNYELLNNFIKSLNSQTLANKYLQYLKTFFNYFVRLEKLYFNPCNKIKKFKLPEKQPLYFSNDELDKLLAVVNPEIKDVVIFAVNTGMRLSEIINLKFSQIDFDNELIILDNQQNITKSKRVRSIPMNTTVKNIIATKKINDLNDYVFTKNNKPFTNSIVSHTFKKAVREAGINPLLHFHSLRHTFASNLVKNKIPIFAVSKLLGHSDIKTTLIYSHLEANDLREVVETLRVIPLKNIGVSYGVN